MSVKAEEYISQAEKSLNKFSFFSSTAKYEDAAELYAKAANTFKVAQMWSEAGKAYMTAADLYLTKLKDQESDACQNMVNAGGCFKRVSPEEAISAYDGAIDIWLESGRMNMAAKLAKEIAEIQESNAGLVGEAIDSYQRAADYYDMADAKSQSSAMLAKVAELSSSALNPPDYHRAGGIYEKLGRSSLESNLLKFNAKGYFLQALLCHLAQGDSIAASQKLESFRNIDYTLADSREGKFAGQLIECIEKYDSDSFATACAEFDRISRLDPWKTAILLKVKRTIDGGEMGNDGNNDDDFDLT
uniref:Alpha-soluble NSF attachment protein n=1 Tax=Corethron hystrix TaxID=216773 RepID=A0A6U5JA08_9STRA|mmetsp:Transcript_36575/g.85503  ORF Transcript_36575/g.85503 Transcript_36575/m.85503 type:complete len:302 (+) Transcript_36575:134-1039(+)|eukprot:CAMPEP_0113310726 /NCGR_PEP_ID=MMETSP0010_2-20120614/8257_1 /TAXON_ID=216773 ORGANISM="Corethron hystrix, Strain 308" /NCGR_SAMPLE_ID=MMETSP0010_2 /ASSEMBLY_ACC=CAM_ASM_000155 /LENGTH=301 /DNA_ID=CAMNT_0000166241 /DNA_START=127 /DNA_END=1032 /DNA_ORIENTATION=+ /assembly_acc=CAM_ASM_000155